MYALLQALVAKKVQKMQWKENPFKNIVILASTNTLVRIASAMKV